jgi:Zn-dependent peptidase ImmA (M78 family)
MELPKSVSIAGISIRIVRADLSEDDVFGTWSLDRKTITIHKPLSGKRLKETIRHEMLHAVLDISGVSFTEGGPFPDENVVRALESLFFGPWDRMQVILNK